MWPTAPGGLRMHVIGDLHFKSGVKIINNPNGRTRLQFDVNKALYVQNEGYLVAKGTPESPAVFTGMVTQRQKS